MDAINKKVPRVLLASLKRACQPNKVILLLGPRRVGKTVLLKTWAKDLQQPYIFWNGEDMGVQEALSRRTVENYRSLIGSNKMIFIDEAQNIPEVGRVLKLMVDELEGVSFVISGSSAINIRTGTGEPLTGRQKVFHLYPLAETELSFLEDPIAQRERLRERLVFGNYPELLHIPDQNEKAAYLTNLVQSYLLRDILALDNIQYSRKILELLQLIALQVGSEVSIQELGAQLGLSKNTVERYLDLLTKVFIIYRLGGYSRNLRKEITKSSKWYFFDNGIRNVLASNLNPLPKRKDVGILWENYALAERLKYQAYSGMLSYNYFWRTYDQQEIDWIEDREGSLHAYEMKWNPGKTKKVPLAFSKAYPAASFDNITPDNLMNWVRLKEEQN